MTRTRVRPSQRTSRAVRATARRVGLLTLLAASGLSGCVLAPRTAPLELTGFRAGSARTVAVLPFTGEDGYPRVAGEWTAFRLAESGGTRVIGPEEAAVRLRDAGSSWSGDESSIVRAAGALGADVVVSGSTSRAASGPASHPALGLTLHVWDGATGRRLGGTTAYSGFVIDASDYGIMKASADAAAAELARALFGATTALSEED